MWRAPEVFTLGHSPDPDDAFMFYAIAKNKIDVRGYRFEHRLEDIQTLNERATRGELYISASGGKTRPDCHCRSAETLFGKISPRMCDTIFPKSCVRASTSVWLIATKLCNTLYLTRGT